MIRKNAHAYGYIIVDTDGHCQLDTLASNATKCWDAFLGVFNSAPHRRDEIKKYRMKQGYRSRPVWVREHVSK